MADLACDVFELPVSSPFSAAAGGVLGALASARDGALVGLSLFPSPAAALAALPAGSERRADRQPLPDARRQLGEYLAGERRAFDLPLAPRGTEFERQVWQALAAIPYGETRSYLEIAAAIGRPAACRAVGRANGSNPIAVVIPCHRVIGADGSLTGYGGGLPLKRFLLDLEGAHRGATPGSPVRQLALPAGGPTIAGTPGGVTGAASHRAMR
jgi:methylated-DNA-[protein]-cysteine S-methyltransferase